MEAAQSLVDAFDRRCLFSYDWSGVFALEKEMLVAALFTVLCFDNGHRISQWVYIESEVGLACVGLYGSTYECKRTGLHVV